MRNWKFSSLNGSVRLVMVIKWFLLECTFVFDDREKSTSFRQNPLFFIIKLFFQFAPFQSAISSSTTNNQSAIKLKCLFHIMQFPLLWWKKISLYSVFVRKRKDNEWNRFGFLRNHKQRIQRQCYRLQKTNRCYISLPFHFHKNRSAFLSAGCPNVDKL